MGNHVGRSVESPIESIIKLENGLIIKAWYDYSDRSIKACIVNTSEQPELPSTDHPEGLPASH